MKWATSGAIRSPSRHFRSLLRACGQESSLATGKKIHAIIVTTGIVNSPNSFLFNALFHMYAVCGVLGYARKLFDEIPQWKKDTVDWTIMMGCFTRYGEPIDSLRLFIEMRRWDVEVDDVTMVCFFSSCARLADVVVGREGHGFMVKTGLGLSVKASNSIMDMYVKTKNMGGARKVFEEMNELSVVSWSVILGGAVRWEGVSSGREVFDKMPERNEIAWSIMIVGYVESRFTQEGFALLAEMIFNYGIELNYVMISSILSACAQSGNFMIGRWLHVYVLKMMGNDMDIMVGTALVDMYAKCGRIDTAFRVFKYTPERNVVAWNAMLSGLAMHGRGDVLLEIFPQMVKEARSDDITFIAVLSACSHSGFVDQGCRIFYDLESVYGIRPQIEHYACMVDLLGRAGRLEEAEIIIKSMPIPPNEVILGSLLGSCNLHGKLELGERILEELLQIDPHNTENHILISNMYSLAGKMEKANSIRRNLKNRGIKKIPGISSIHVGGQVIKSL